MESIIEAYSLTNYWVDTDESRICIRVGEANPDLDALLEQFEAREWAYVTAYNPGSVTLAAEENEERHRRLIRDVEKTGYRMLSGEGCGVVGDWPPEPSVLILGMPFEEARMLGRLYGQTAILVGLRKERPRLLLCLP